MVVGAGAAGLGLAQTTTGILWHQKCQSCQTIDMSTCLDMEANLSSLFLSSCLGKSLWQDCPTDWTSVSVGDEAFSQAVLYQQQQK